jgi:hypothetical protein
MGLFGFDENFMEEMNKELRECFSTRNLRPDGHLKELADAVLERISTGTKTGEFAFDNEPPRASGAKQAAGRTQRGPLSYLLQTKESQVGSMSALLSTPTCVHLATRARCAASSSGTGKSLFSGSIY